MPAGDEMQIFPRPKPIKINRYRQKITVQYQPQRMRQSRKSLAQRLECLAAQA